MWSKTDVIDNAMSIFLGKEFNIRVIDFFHLCSNVSFAMRKRHGDFRDELVKRFSVYPQDSPDKQNRCCKWSVEIMYSQIIDDVIHFNENYKSVLESRGLIFVCLDNEVLPHQQALLKRSYLDSIFFPFDLPCVNKNYQRIFTCLEEKKSKSIVQNTLLNFYPLLLHVDSISTGLVFNYYYSYLNRQIGSTNNIFLTFTFNKNMTRESLPSTISVVLNTLIENTFLEKCPLTIQSNYLIPIQSNLLILEFDSIKYRSLNEIETIVVYSIVGVNDFGLIVETIRIWQDKFDVSSLTGIQLKDDVRGWKEEYQPCSDILRENHQTTLTFENREDRRKKCHILPIVDTPSVRNDGHTGVSTMKKTTKDCYDSYINDPKNAFTRDGRRISKILVAPVYYIIMPSSCQFGTSDINQTSECDEIVLKGTIIDPNLPNRIQLAYVHNNVLRSHPMIQCNRYLRRTFYFIDEIDNNNEVIRYLFCGEYPNILSTLNHLQKSAKLSANQKHDEYLRFCNMLNRLVQFNNLSESIKLIQFNDEDDQIDCSDFKPLCDQLKEDIDQWYHTSDNNIFYPSIESKIIHIERTSHVLLFFTDKAKEDQLIVILINDIKDKLELNGFIVEDAKGNLNFIETNKQIIFICTGRKNDKINRSIINAIQQKINKIGVLQDVFILINNAIREFPCRFIRSIPFLSFDLQRRTAAHLNPHEIQQIIFYLNNMNVLSKCYTGNFDDINQFLNESSLQCTSVGEGCAAAFYFNYAKLITSSSDHKYRIELINKQLEKENLINNKSASIQKWIFLIPSTIKNTNQILSNGLKIIENEQKRIGLKLSVWKSTDSEFNIPDLTVTVGGVFQRSYSPLTIYQLTNLTTGQNIYFPMEIPAALHGLQTQYENLLSHLNFGKFDPAKQGSVFRKKIQEYLSNDQDKICRENLIFIPFDNTETSIGSDPTRNVQQAQILLETLWNKLFPSIQDN